MKRATFLKKSCAQELSRTRREDYPPEEFQPPDPQEELGELYDEVIKQAKINYSVKIHNFLAPNDENYVPIPLSNYTSIGIK